MRVEVLWLTLLFVFGTPLVDAQDRHQLEEAVKPLVVMLDVKVGGAPDYGAGIISGVNSDRVYIVTANHVVRRGGKDAESIQVGFSWLPGEIRPGQLLATYDDQLDLAVIMVDRARDLAIPQLPFDLIGIASSLKKGDSVFPMGYPNREQRLTRALPDAISSVQDRVRFDSSFVVPGHSGGALLTATFRIVGLITDSLPSQGGLAVPIERVTQALQQWNYPVQWQPDKAAAPAQKVGRGGAGEEASPAHPSDGPQPNRWYRLQAKHTLMYLDVTWGSREDHAPVGQSGVSTYLDGGAQLWRLVPAGDGWYRLQAKHTSMYLDVTWGSREDHAPVGQSGLSTYLDGGAQLWKLIPAGDGWYRLQVKHTSMYLDVTWGSREDHAPVGQSGLSNYLGGAAQFWRFVPD